MKHIETLLTEMTIEQKLPVLKILELKSNDNKLIIEKLSKILLPVGGFLQTPLSYSQFVEKIANANNENIDFSLDIRKAEKELYLKLFQQEFERLSDEEKENIYNELEKSGLNKSQIKSLSGISALGAAQLSGFGIYLLASSTLGAISSVLGITLPFAFYTGMSSVISFVIGPVGFLVMGVLVYRNFKNVKSWDEAFDLLKASWSSLKSFAIGDTARSTLVFKYFAATRIVLTENLQNQIKENSSKINTIKNNITEIDTEILKKQEEFKSVNNQICQLKEKIDIIKNCIKEKINDKKSNENEILKSENDSKVKLSKIEKLNN